MAQGGPGPPQAPFSCPCLLLKQPRVSKAQQPITQQHPAAVSEHKVQVLLNFY